MNKILVTAKVNPDLDGTACTLAYSYLLNQTKKKAEGIIFGSPQSEVQYFVEKHNIKIPAKPDGYDRNWENFILVDASSIKGMPVVVKSEKVIEIIDHRKSEPEKEFPNAKVQNELIGAAATLIVERFIEAKVRLLPDHAKLLYGAIYHNTLNFLATNTSDRDKKAVKYLEEEFGLDRNLINEMFETMTKIINKDIYKALKDDAKEFGKDVPMGALQLIFWGSEILKNRKFIENAVEKLSNDYKYNWSYLNLVDLEDGVSTIYSKSKLGQGLLSKILDCKFENGWAKLNKPWLRKQIMPEIINLTKN